ncbi:hypothetical protein Tco_0293796 [Tanacetum coccineum]
MTLFASSTKSSLYVLFFALLCFSTLAREYSFVGYTPEDLTCIDKVITSSNHGSQNTENVMIFLKRSYIGWRSLRTT